MPLLIIGVSFKKVGIYLVGPLPQSAQGHEHILVIVDYTTRYPKVVSLWKVTSKNIARELVLLFSHMGFPKDILADQGMPFVSKLMADVCQLLHVWQIHTSVYHGWAG